ncbi:MAG: 3-dehydroquinate synthase [Anaerofustis sp.]
MKTLRVNLKENSYDIQIGAGLLHHAGELIRTVYPGKRAVLVSDIQIWKLHGKALIDSLTEVGIEPQSVILPQGEQVKQLSNLEKLYTAFVEAGLTRSDIVIAFGGGVIGDLTGFAAATYMRGIRYIQIPTTLLAQVDASVGGKTAVDLNEGKNLVGAFWQPKTVIMDTDVLTTLTGRDFSSGMAEVIKYGAIRSESLFERLESIADRTKLMNEIEEIIYECCNIKRAVVEADERDTGERMLLNFGHTFGHAVEKLGNFETFTHGESVAIGMMLAVRLGIDLGITDREVLARMQNVISQFGLPTESDYTVSDMFDTMLHDKKNISDQINFILLRTIGESIIEPMPTVKLDELINGRSDEWTR